ncbi:hypothetical protein FOL47_003290 [Perkinsus chesapeaki]|uniref:Uncharacterized protein n=1 Tax=Perkinsus chesapeaki TaxID=330153 RepID=A0A7J6N2T6_PERCH|nr:hypothetical protein FOL47_003290 [Perkinsus chesapeaki]
MVRIVAVTVASALAIALSGCSSDSTSSNDSTAASPTTPSATGAGPYDPQYPDYPVVTTTQSPCPIGDAFCQSQTVNGGDFSNSFCKYWLTNQAFCQGPPGSTDPQQLNVPCECPSLVTSTVTTTTVPTTSSSTEQTTSSPRTEVSTSSPSTSSSTEAAKSAGQF